VYFRVPGTLCEKNGDTPESVFIFEMQEYQKLVEPFNLIVATKRARLGFLNFVAF